jgi:hypothetical protein
MAGGIEWDDPEDQLSLTDRLRRNEDPTRSEWDFFALVRGEVFPALAISKHPRLSLSQPNFKQQFKLRGQIELTFSKGNP